MTIIFKLAQDNLRIPEREYAISPQIGFNKFSSCLGIVALLDDGNLIGIHLAILEAVEQNPKQFGDDPQDVPRVLKLLEKKKKVIIVGDESCWQGDGTFSKAYRELKDKLGNPEVIVADQEEKGARGVYHARKVNDDIKLMICIESQTGPQPGQTSRSSDNFSSQEDPIVGPEGTPIKFTLPKGITVNIADDNSGAPDPTLFTDVTNDTEVPNPYINELYVAEVRGANENFFVCIEKV